MYLFVFESIGTSELILIGIVALVFLGPRKLPEIARKIGKMMAEFRGTANEFKQTWQREVNFEDEAKALSIQELEKEATAAQVVTRKKEPPAPAIKEIDKAAFDQQLTEVQAEELVETGDEPSAVNDKRNWL